GRTRTTRRRSRRPTSAVARSSTTTSSRCEWFRLRRAMPYLLPIGLIAVVWLAIVVLSERWNLLSCDRFPTPVHKYAAYAWLGAFMLFLAYLVTGSALRPATSS